MFCLREPASSSSPKKLKEQRKGVTSNALKNETQIGNKTVGLPATASFSAPLLGSALSSCGVRCMVCEIYGVVSPLL